jgi:uncharacterized protein
MLRSAAWLAVGLWLAGAVAAPPPAGAQREAAVPRLERRVTDLTATLTPAQATQLEDKLAAFETRKGSQIAVLIVPTTQPEAIEQYSIRVVEQWKLGRKGVDDAALLLVAKDDRQLRIEVGRGLEGALTDLHSKRIIDELIVPRFRGGDFAGGITAGVDAILKVVSGEPLPEPPRRAPSGGGGSSGGGWDLGTVAFIGLVVITFAGNILRQALGRLPAAAAVGGVAAAVGWVVVGSLLAAAAVGGVAFLLVLLGGVPVGGVGRHAGGGSWSGGGGWSSGGGGGGFSGGGGSFGGGGASGRW